MSIKSKNGAFTLTELMIVVAIIGIAVSIAIPNIVEWLPDQRLKSATRDVISSMQEAKLEAIRQNATVTLVFDSSASPGYYFFDTNNDATWQAGEKRVNLVDYKSGINFGSGAAVKNWSNINISDHITFTGDKVGFTGRGFSNMAGTVYLENKNNDICFAITVITTGSIKLRKYSGGTWTN